jgi:hypothetical protein
MLTWFKTAKVSVSSLVLAVVSVLATVLLIGSSGCDNQQRAKQDAVDTANNRNYYTMKNDVEYKNYDRRIRLADDPTTILWCTSAFPGVPSSLFTVPIVGKQTSGSKRPFDTEPGPDGMYGTSGDYRYGFTPAKILSDAIATSQKGSPQ